MIQNQTGVPSSYHSGLPTHQNKREVGSLRQGQVTWAVARLSVNGKPASPVWTQGDGTPKLTK